MKKILIMLLVLILVFGCGKKESSKSKQYKCQGFNKHTEFIFTVVSDDEDKMTRKLTVVQAFPVPPEEADFNFEYHNKIRKPLDKIPGTSWEVILSDDKASLTATMNFDMATFDWQAYMALGEEWEILWLNDYIDRAVNVDVATFISYINEKTVMDCAE